MERFWLGSVRAAAEWEPAAAFPGTDEGLAAALAWLEGELAPWESGRRITLWELAGAAGAGRRAGGAVINPWETPPPGWPAGEPWPPAAEPEALPWWVIAGWRAWYWVTWPWWARELKRRGFRRTGWMRWESPPDPPDAQTPAG